MTHSPIDIFRHHSFNISKSITNSVNHVVDKLWASRLISDDIKDSLSTVLGIDNYTKASRLMGNIHNTLSSHSNPTEYLTEVCYALFHIDNESLKHFLISILKELGKPLPQGKDQCIKPILHIIGIMYTDSRQDCSKSSSLLNKRPRAAQGTYIINNYNY